MLARHVVQPLTMQGNIYWKHVCLYKLNVEKAPKRLKRKEIVDSGNLKI